MTSASFCDHASISGSPDLSCLSPQGHSRTSSARLSGSRPSQHSPSHSELLLHTDAHNTPCAENEALTTSSHDSRHARPSALSPGPSTHPILPLHSAISEQYLSYTPDQHVILGSNLLNLPSISHRPGLSPTPGQQVFLPTVLESSTLSSSSTRHVAINKHSARPRTSNQVFNNISDLAAHYGIPQFLPTAPRTTPRRTAELEESSSLQQSETFSSSADFAHLCTNYLTMLSQEPGDSDTNEAPIEGIAPVAAVEVTDAEAIRSLLDVLNVTPELQMANDLNEYLTSPLIESPLDDELLTTPAVGSDMHADVFTSPLLGDFIDDSFDEFPPLFGDINDPLQMPKPPHIEPPVVPPQPNLDNLYRMDSPSTPFIDSAGPSPFDRKKIPLPSTTKRKFNATGTRKNLTPESLVPVDAPTQSRNYLTPSVTSRKELPAAWRRKRQRTADPADEEDQLPEEGLTPTLSEQEQIEMKRRQNTIAARRSRKRKLEYQRELEESVEQYKQESEMWKQRAMTYQALLRSHHIEFTDS